MLKFKNPTPSVEESEVRKVPLSLRATRWTLEDQFQPFSVLNHSTVTTHILSLNPESSDGAVACRELGVRDGFGGSG
jgi:hypothetical protein